MTLQQLRHIKLWFAGRAGNWRLADYEIGELQEGFGDVDKLVAIDVHVHAERNAGEAPDPVTTEILEALSVAPDPFTVALVEGAAVHGERIDALMAAAAKGWEVDRMPVLDRSILRLATYELIAEPDVPVAVVIDEAVELAKQYSTEFSGGFVNGVLSTIARQVRP